MWCFGWGLVRRLVVDADVSEQFISGGSIFIEVLGSAVCLMGD